VARHFEITERRNSIRISVREDLPAWARILIGLIAAVAAFSLGRGLLGNWIWMVALCIAAVSFATAKGSRADLNVTNVELVTRGNMGRRGGRATQIVCTGDVGGLEFRDKTGQRSGLYALTVRRAKCVLPFVGYAEAMEVVRAIQTKYPGLAEIWRAETGPSEDAITPGLGK